MPASSSFSTRAGLDEFEDFVASWMVRAFGQELTDDKNERAYRFIEEAVELVQAAGLNVYQVRAMVNYVFGRPIGALPQEAGGVMVTLAAFLRAHKLNMRQVAFTELARAEDRIDEIREKRKHKPLPFTINEADVVKVDSGKFVYLFSDEQLQQIRDAVVKAVSAHFAAQFQEPAKKPPTRLIRDDDVSTATPIDLALSHLWNDGVSTGVNLAPGGLFTREQVVRRDQVLAKVYEQLADPDGGPLLVTDKEPRIGVTCFIWDARPTFGANASWVKVHRTSDGFFVQGEWVESEVRHPMSGVLVSHIKYYRPMFPKPPKG